MSHKIKAPRSDLRVAVVSGDGDVLSWHRTARAAEIAVLIERKKFYRRPGNSNSYIPRSIIEVNGDARIERAGQFSTTWQKE